MIAVEGNPPKPTKRGTVFLAYGYIGKTRVVVVHFPTRWGKQ